MNALAAGPFPQSIETSAIGSKKLRRILFATDFSKASYAALPIVGALARRYGAEVEVLHAVSPVPIVLSEGSVYVPPATESAEKQIMTVMRADVLNGVNLRWSIRLGHATDAIIDEATDRDIDLIVVGTHGYGPVKHFLLGSICEDLARSAPCPVLTVGPHVDKRFSQPERPTRILVPVDFTQASLHVVPTLIRLATDFDTAVTFLHVRSPKQRLAPGSHKLLVSAMRRRFERHVPKTCVTRYLVESGEPAETILSVAYEGLADLIAVGVRTPKDVPFQFGSSITYQIVAGAQCPVLITHPRIAHSSIST